jgi:large subunit ribosomal protein L25
MKELDIKKIVFSPDAYQIDLDIEGKKNRCIIQEIQFHPVTDRIQHVDMLLLSDDRPVKVQLPVRTTGTSPGVMQGGRLAINYRNIAVKGLPKDLPEAISLDISDLQVAQDIRVRDLDIPGCQILQPAAAVIVAVKATRASIAAGTAGAEA